MPITPTWPSSVRTASLSGKRDERRSRLGLRFAGSAGRVDGKDWAFPDQQRGPGDVRDPFVLQGPWQSPEKPPFSGHGLGCPKFAVTTHRVPASSLPIGFESVEVSAAEPAWRISGHTKLPDPLAGRQALIHPIASLSVSSKRWQSLLQLGAKLHFSSRSTADLPALQQLPHAATLSTSSNVPHIPPLLLSVCNDLFIRIDKSN